MRKDLTSLALIGVLSVFAALPSKAQTSPQLQQFKAAIDYQGFTALTAELAAYRETRLVSKDVFLTMAAERDTLILDTRSKAAFDQGHIQGAVHLNFSDFTEGKLAKVIASKDTRILIYCNNNFVDDTPPFAKKKIELALNIPTFINLHGYGYENIYELGDNVRMDDPEMRIVKTEP